MAAPTGEAFAAGTEDRDEVDAIDAATGAFSGVAFVAKDNFCEAVINNSQRSNLRKCKRLLKWAYDTNGRRLRYG
jgi:hypothetical protein